MIEDFTNTEALQYLLNELELGARIDFESRLARDPQVQTALRHCSDAVAQFALENAPAETMLPSENRLALAAIFSATTEEGRGKRPAKFSWVRFGWPAAASLLFLLNLWQLGRSHGSNFFSHWTLPWTASEPRQAVRIVRPVEETATSAGQILKERGAGADRGKKLEPMIAEQLGRLEKLRAEYAALKREHEALRVENEQILHQLEQQTLSPKGGSHLGAMELVDSVSYSNGQRKGLVDLAKGLLTEPGVVAIGPTPPPGTQPMPTPAPGATGSNGTGANPDASSVISNPPGTGPQPTPTPPPTTDAASPSDVPYAWSVYDETDGRGYLNLYNLPTVPSSQTLELWIRSSGGEGYQLVGPVPAQYYGGSGSFSYTAPGLTQSPTEILITQEPTNKIPVQPTGPTVLHGP